MGMLTVELHTVGRKSGKPYANLLTSPVHDDARIVVVASNAYRPAKGLSADRFLVTLDAAHFGFVFLFAQRARIAKC